MLYNWIIKQRHQHMKVPVRYINSPSHRRRGESLKTVIGLVILFAICFVVFAALAYMVAPQ
jgi:uncharacterized membrane protein